MPCHCKYFLGHDVKNENFCKMPQNRLVVPCEVKWGLCPEWGAAAFQGACDAIFIKMTYYIIEARAYARIMSGTYE